MIKLTKIGIPVMLIIIMMIPVGRAQESRSSKGIYLGAAMGSGSLNLNFKDESLQDLSESGLAMDYRFGYAYSDLIHLGVDMDLLLYYRHSKFKSFACYSLVINYYMLDIMYLKAGPSFAIIDEEPTGVEESESAVGFMAGIGLDLRITGKLAFTPSYGFYYNSSSVFSSKYHVFAIGGSLYL